MASPHPLYLERLFAKAEHVSATAQSRDTSDKFVCGGEQIFNNKLSQKGGLRHALGKRPLYRLRNLQSESPDANTRNMTSKRALMESKFGMFGTYNRL
jgi:hypothetical protein